MLASLSDIWNFNHFSFYIQSNTALRNYSTGAAARVAGRDLPADEFFALPAFWSDQYEFQLQSYGLPGAGTSHRVASGALDGACIIEYFDEAGALCGVIGIDTVKELMPYRTQFMAAKAWEPNR